MERVWEYLRDRWLSHRVLAGGYDAVVDAACAGVERPPGRAGAAPLPHQLPLAARVRHHFVGPV